jgi:CMP-N-acetylneuraminic acid synthetase
MILKSGNRFSEKIMLKQIADLDPIELNWIKVEPPDSSATLNQVMVAIDEGMVVSAAWRIPCVVLKRQKRARPE